MQGRTTFGAFAIAVGLVLAIATHTPTAGAQTEEPYRPGRTDGSARVRQLHQQAVEAFARTDYERAEDLLLELVDLDGDNFVVYYNLACVYARQGEAELAGEMLFEAVNHGFSDLRQLKTDPDLAGARDDPNYLKIVENWELVVSLQGRARFDHLKSIYDEGYAYSTDEDLRLQYLSSFDDVTTRRTREELRLIGDWALRNVFTHLHDPGEDGNRWAGTDAWVAVILPTQRDFDKWAFSRFGAAARSGTRQIGGSYLHDRKMLIVMDLGGTLRHEFFHVLHWRSMVRLGQAHPIWIQEGLGTLIEDYEVERGPGGDGLQIVPSWRTNIVRNLAQGGRLMGLRGLATMSHETFANRNSLANYAQARAMLMFINERADIAAWYRAYTESFREDPTGIGATLRVLGYDSGFKDLEMFDRDYRLWARSLPRVPEQLDPPPVRLGFETERTAGDGMLVTGFNSLRARRSGLRLGDVVHTLEGRPVRDINELLRRLDGRAAGETVAVGYRRGAGRRAVHGEVEIVLEAR